MEVPTAFEATHPRPSQPCHVSKFLQFLCSVSAYVGLQLLSLFPARWIFSVKSLGDGCAPEMRPVIAKIAYVDEHGMSVSVDTPLVILD